MINLLFAILILYSLIPYNINKVISYRLGGLPVSYIPFLTIFLFTFIKQLLNHNKNSDYIIPLTLPVRLLFCYYYYLIINFCILSMNGRLHYPFDFIFDAIAYIFYGVIICQSIIVFYYNKKNRIEWLDNTIEKFLKIMCVICIISIVRYFLFDYGNTSFFHILPPLRYRLTTVLFLIICNCLAIGWYNSTKNKKFIYYFPLFFFCMLLSGSRTGLVSLGAIIIFIILKERIRFFFSFKFFLILFACLVIFLQFHDFIVDRISRISEFSMIITGNLEEAQESHKSSKRTAFTKMGIELIQKYPLLGVGLGKNNVQEHFSNYVLRITRNTVRSHNFYISLLQSVGLLGFIIFGMFIVAILSYGYRANKLTKKKKSVNLKILYMLYANIVILISCIGYEYETQPFVWMFWAFSFCYFKFSQFNNSPVMIEQGVKSFNVCSKIA